MPPASHIIAAALRTWDDPVVDRGIYGTVDPDEIAAIADEFVHTHLGARINEHLFFSTSVGSVHGLVLTDARRIILKIYPRDRWPGWADHLRAVHRVQHHLADAGYPCPRPLIGPHPCAYGLAIAESFLAVGDHADPFDPHIRRTIAAGLAELVARTREFADTPGLRPSLLHDAGGSVWPTPHSALFDFSREPARAAWIDDWARRARASDPDVGAWIVGHIDWRAEHLRFTAGRITTVYDWDSLARIREPALVGQVARAFPADWQRDGVRCVPDLEDILGFLADYEAARGAPFTRDERRSARAACVYAIAYTARCGHALDPDETEDRAGGRSFRGLLARHAADLLVG